MVITLPHSHRLSRPSAAKAGLSNASPAFVYELPTNHALSVKQPPRFFERWLSSKEVQPQDFVQLASRMSIGGHP